MDTLTTLGLILLLARAFSSGCAALTGVEAISNGVPAFQRPKSKNAATTLLLLGSISITMMVSIIVLANQMGIRYVDPHHFEQLSSGGEPVGEDYDQNPVIAQIAQAVFNDFPPALLLRGHGHRRSSSCWPPTRRSTGSRSWARSWPRTASRRGPWASAVTGSPTATASSSSR